MTTVLITGANRGIGLALTQIYLNNDAVVIATARDLSKATELRNLQQRHSSERLILETVDVGNDKSVKDLWGRLANISGVDILINNAGILQEYNAGLTELSFAAMQETFSVNTLGPLRMVRYALPKLMSGARIVNVSSKVGSIQDNSGGRAYAYRTSKTALNMVNKNISLEFPEYISIVMHPGWVQTDMGGAAAPTSTTESAAGIYAVVSKLKAKDNGRFLDFRGQEIPW